MGLGIFALSLIAPFVLWFASQIEFFPVTRRRVSLTADPSFLDLDENSPQGIPLRCIVSGRLMRLQILHRCRRKDMKTRTILLTLALCFVGAAVCFAQDPNIGTWKLNEAKSHMPPQLSKNSTVVFEAVGDNVKVTMDGIDKDGKPIHSEWTGKF